MKLCLSLYYRLITIFSVICTLVLINPLQAIAVESTIPQASRVDAAISEGVIKVVIKEEHVADIITVNAMPSIAESFVGHSEVIPGLKHEGFLEIKNETGEAYKVIDYNFSAKMTDLKRIYNDAAASLFGEPSATSHEQVVALSGDEWYKLNAEYFGEESFTDMDVLRKVFGWGDATQGAALSGYETGQKMIDLGFNYLFQHCIQFSFNTNTDPVNSYATKNIHMLDYINKTDANRALMLNRFFADEIGNEDLLMRIGYGMDNSRIGNAYNSAYADFGFELMLERIVNDEPETVMPGKPESKPDTINPDIAGQPDPSSDSTLFMDDGVSSAPEAGSDAGMPLEKIPKTGMTYSMMNISFLFVFCGAALLIHKKQ